MMVLSLYHPLDLVNDRHPAVNPFNVSIAGTIALRPDFIKLRVEVSAYPPHARIALKQVPKCSHATHPAM